MENKQFFNLPHTLRLSTFQIGSAMGDVLVGSIWNRILISTFGIPATPVSLILALRYLLMPLSLWVGHLSDTRPLWGMRRTSYIWLGRGAMVLALPFLGVSVNLLEADQASVAGWGSAVFSSLLYGVGSLISGGTFLALVRDSAPQEKQGLALNVVEIMLIVFFAVSGITFSQLMEQYDRVIFWDIIILTMAVGGFFWFFAIAGAEKRMKLWKGEKTAVSQPNFSATLRHIWQDSRTRLFFVFLFVATLAAWMQEAVLEPFGADALNLEYQITTRLSSYWQTATVITLVGTAYLARKQSPEQQRGIASNGLLVMAGGMFLLGLTALLEQRHLLELSLLVYGAGFGVYTFGGFSLMAAMASNEEAGAYMGLWTVCILVSRGLGTFLGGLLRDMFWLQAELSVGVAYGLVFVVSAVGLGTAVLLLSRLDVVGFVQENGRIFNHPNVQTISTD